MLLICSVTFACIVKYLENASLSIVILVWEIERSLLEPNLASRRDGEALLLVFL
jgi:hypothetical protein